MNKILKYIRLTAISVVVFNVFLLNPAYAYVDPGSGSVLVTTVLGIIAAVGYTFRRFFYNMRAKFFKRKPEESDRSLDD